MEEKMKELLISMTVSAAGLPGEPKIYGSLRLIDSAKDLAGILLENDPGNAVLRDFVELVESNKEKNMTDPNGFYDMLQQAVLILTDM